MKKLNYFTFVFSFILLLAFGCDKSSDLVQIKSNSPVKSRSAIVSHENFTFIEEDTVMHPCTFEPVRLYAKHRVVVHSVISGSGHVHLTVNDNVSQAEMTGLVTGWDYQVNFNQHQSMNYDSDELPFTQIIHIVSLSHVPGIGQTGGFKIHLKITVTPNGEISVLSEKLEIVCP